MDTVENLYLRLLRDKVQWFSATALNVEEKDRVWKELTDLREEVFNADFDDEFKKKFEGVFWDKVTKTKDAHELVAEGLDKRFKRLLDAKLKTEPND